ncbi:DUF5819 family protein [Streptomyces sp. NPDC055036]
MPLRGFDVPVPGVRRGAGGVLRGAGGVPRGAGGRDAVTALTIGGLAAWFTLTMLSQHPKREFDRLAEYDKSGIAVPNWRFFAPEPAQHDYHVLLRTETADGRQTDWAEASAITPRRPVQMVWFPGRRREKALFDVCHELIAVMRKSGGDLTRTTGYRMLRNAVARSVRETTGDGAPPRGFQFVVARHTGHDTDHEPDYVFVSPYIPYDSADPYV